MEGLPMDKLGLDASKTAPFVEKLKYNIATSSISATVDSVINGTPLTENLKNGLVNAAVTVVGAEAASAIGEAARLGDINTTTQLIAHAALGCAMGAANGDCKAGAIGGATGEIIGGVYSAITAAELNDDIQEIWNMHDLPESARELRIVEIQYEWRARGVDVAKISAAIVAAVTGVNVDTAVTTSGNAAENNALFLIPIAAAALYTMYVGEGDFREGLREIGRGNDPLSETIADGVTKTVELSAKHYPDETKAVLQVVADLDGAVDATIQYIDKKTGKVVSTTWNTIDQNTRDEIKGGVAVLSVIIPATSVSKLAKISKLPDISKNDALKITHEVDVTESKAFYDPQKWRQNYEDFYSGNVISTTVPPYSTKNVQLAGKRHLESGIVFDQRGFPIFDDIAKYDTRLPLNEFTNASYTSQMRMATRDLKLQITAVRQFCRCHSITH